MTNQTDLISEVRAALAAADTTPWEQDEGPYILNSNGHVVCRFWDLEDKYMNDRNNKHLISNAPTWLQQLTDRLETAEKQRDEAVKALEAIIESTDMGLIYGGIHEEASEALKRIKGENGHGN